MSLRMAKELSHVDRLAALCSFSRRSPDALIGAIGGGVSARTVNPLLTSVPPNLSDALDRSLALLWFTVLPIDLKASEGWWYNSGMKIKTSVTLSEDVLEAIDARIGPEASRSEFIEGAVRRYLSVLSRREQDARDLEIMNRHAEAMNAEASDLLDYQVEP